MPKPKPTTWLSTLLNRNRLNQQLDEELRTYIDLLTAEKIAAGIPPTQAHREAMIESGTIPQIKQSIREGRPGMTLETLAQDARYALRTLAKDRAFSIVVIAILALGIGANTAVFSVVNRILLQPLPYTDSSRLVFAEPGHKLSPKLLASAGLSGRTFDVDSYQNYQRNSHVFTALTSFNPFYASSEYTLTGTGQPLGMSGVQIEQNFLTTLGIQPQLGRNFTTEECQKGGRPAAILSNSFWRTAFHSDPAILGRVVDLNKHPYTIVGVLPATFDFASTFAPGQTFQIFTPAVLENMRQDGNTLSAVGRLKPGITLTQAQADTDLTYSNYNAAHPTPFDFTPTLTNLKQFVTGKLQRSMTVLWAAVGLVLLIVCVNLSSLIVTRAASRTREFAMRTALGASRQRILQQLLIESLILALTGAALGLTLAFAITAWLAHQSSIALPLLSSVNIDATTVAFTLLLTIAITTILGFAPALKLSDRNLQSALKSTSASTTPAASSERLRSTLVIAEIAITCILLVGAGLLLRSFLSTLNEDLGFNPEQASTMKIDYDQSGNGSHRAVVLQELIRRIQTIPGVTSAAVGDMLPLGKERAWQFYAKSHPPAKGQIDVALVRVVTPGYFQSMGMTLKTGRDFNWTDTANLSDKDPTQPKREQVVILNEAAAQYFWPNENALNQLSVPDGNDEGSTRVIGIVRNVRQSSLESKPGPEIYLPVMQFMPEGAELVIRSTLPASTLAPSVLSILRSTNPSQPAYELLPLDTLVTQAVSPKKFLLVLVLSFATLGLILASLGIYGVIAYSVTQRTQEIGIRMALGATTQQVQRTVMARTLRLAIIGLTIGTAASYATARAITTLLYSTTPNDPITYAAMILLLATVALAAGYLPARRASKINPIQALRQ